MQLYAKRVALTARTKLALFVAIKPCEDTGNSSAHPRGDLDRCRPGLACLN